MHVRKLVFLLGSFRDELCSLHIRAIDFTHHMHGLTELMMDLSLRECRLREPDLCCRSKRN